MRETYLHRLSRPYRATAAAAPALDPEPAATGEQGVAAERGGGDRRRLAIESGLDGRVRLSRPEIGRHQRNAASARRRHAGGACEVCGRTLLAGERAREIILGERPVQACPLCDIGVQRAARARAA